MARDGRALQLERELVQGEGFEAHADIQLLAKRNWYRPDGTLVGLLPADRYHEDRFRAKGWTLHPSPVTGEREKHFWGFGVPVAPIPDADGRIPYVKEG